MPKLTPYDTVIERLEANALWRFPGGVHPEEHKVVSNQIEIARPPLPDALYIPLKQHIGSEGHCIVKVGEQVLKGQPLTNTFTPYTVPVHAPTSGTVASIGEHVSAHPSGLPEHTIKLIPDGLDEWIKLTPNADYTSLEHNKIVEILCDAGISGLGGAGFPTHIKTNGKKPIEFLIINGIECEPYISADDRLMREFAWQIRQGIDILQHVIGPKTILVAVEDNKPQAMQAMQIACEQKADCMVVSVPTVYPAGGEKQLIQVLTGREVPRDGLPEDIGTVMFNVGTCFAIADAVCHGKPLIERVVTLTGGALNSPQNVWALLGTPVGHLVEFAGYQKSKQSAPHIIMGGPMMGFSVIDEAVPVVKITNCLLVPEKNELRSDNMERPCIRCSACADACPASLLPQQLYWHAKAKELEKAEQYNLFDCIECGACAYVCPSDIPLVQYYREAKSTIRNERDEKNKSERAKIRFEARKQRLEAEKQEREARHRKAAEARLAAQQAAKAKASEEAGDSGAKATSGVSKPKSAAAAAAIARAKAKAEAKKQTEQPNQVEPASASSTTAKPKSAAAAAAIARAKAKAQAKKPESKPNESQELDAEAQKKAQVAAAVARAKAKAKARAQQKNDLADNKNEPTE